MNLENLRSKLNVHRVWFRSQKLKEKDIECFIMKDDGYADPITNVTVHKDDDGKLIIVFK